MSSLLPEPLPSPSLEIPVLLGQLMELATLGLRLLGTWGSAFTKSPQRNKQETARPISLECLTSYILLLMHTFATRAGCFSTHGHRIAILQFEVLLLLATTKLDARQAAWHNSIQSDPMGKAGSLVDNETFWLQVMFEFFRSHRKDSGLIKASGKATWSVFSPACALLASKGETVRESMISLSQEAIPCKEIAYDWMIFAVSVSRPGKNMSKLIAIPFKKKDGCNASECYVNVNI